MVEVYDNRVCALGEGPLWHPLRKQLFWFDILGSKMLSLKDGKPSEWQFDETVSAAGWTGKDTLLIASETALFNFDLTRGTRTNIAPLEADNPATRSNDGRADPWGGFWIGTMGKRAEHQAGCIYRYFEGTVEALYQDITIPNAICFSLDRSHAYYTDTPTRQIMKQPLDQDGWPKGPSAVFIDLNSKKLNPDGAVIDSEGNIWVAQWGAGRVAKHSPDGQFLSEIQFPAAHVTCPAFGGESLEKLFATSATQDISSPAATDGATFVADTTAKGHAEHRVRL